MNEPMTDHDLVAGALVDEDGPTVFLCPCWCECFRFVHKRDVHCPECLNGDHAHPYGETGGEA